MRKHLNGYRYFRTGLFHDQTASYLLLSYLTNASTFGWDEHPGTNSLERNASVIISLFLLPDVNAPMHATLASLLRRARCAEYTSDRSAAYTPFTLFAAIDMPMPVPQIKIPLSYFFDAIASATLIAVFA